MNDPSVLVIDDNPDHRELTVMALSDCCNPNQIATALDGVDALDFIHGRGRHERTRPIRSLRLVLLDLKLGRVNGLEVLQAIRANPRTRGLPVIMLSSSNEKRDLAACYDSGANGYMRKSTNFEELSNKLRQAYEFWTTVNEGFQHSSA